MSTPTQSPDPFHDWISSARDDLPDPSRWRDAQRRLSDQLRLHKKENPIMTAIRKTYSTRLGRIATAATVAAAILVVLAVGSHAPSPALADVMKQIERFRPYECTVTTQWKGKPAQTKRLMRLDPSHRREIWSNGDVLVFDLSRRPVQTLILKANSKQAYERTITGVGPANDPDLLRILAEARNADAENLGAKQIDGRKVQGYRTTGSAQWTIWADVNTHLPVHIELVQEGIDRKIVMSDFNFDVDFDPALFSTTAPEGYAVKRTATEGKTPTERDLIDGLRTLAKLLDGTFPRVREFTFQEIQQALAARRTEPWTKDTADSARETITRATRYVSILRLFRGAKDIRYAGGGVRLGDASTPILWWQPNDSNTYRVIYGDLTAKDVDPSDLPK